MDYWPWWLVLLVIIMLIGVSISDMIDISNKKKAIKKKLESLPNFLSTQIIIGEDGNSAMSIDEERKKIILVKHTPEDIILKPITYKDILSSEIFVDGETITKVARGSQIGGALIGGLALGGVGAIIGGLSGNKSSHKKIKRVDLRVIVNDTNNPLHDINFMNIEVNKDNMVYKYAMDDARHWHGLISILIKMADNEDATSLSQANSDNTLSIADELSKLSNLRDKGVLSDKEFFMQKEKLLS